MTKASLILAAVVVVTLPAQAADPWDAPFSRDTAQILSAARALKTADGADAVVLLHEEKHAIDSAGRTTSTLRKVYRILTQDGTDDWSTVEQEYAAWHERKPELRARVIGADGLVHALDPKTITESPAVEFDAKIFSDRRVLRAPLPAVGVGCVVEFEVIIRETAPLFDAGVTRRIQLWSGAEIRRAHVVIESHSAVPLRVVARLIPESAGRRSESRAGVRHEYDWGPILPPKDIEFSTPFDVPTRPVVEFSTGRSWQELASRYSAVVDSRIGAQGVSLLGGPAAPGETPKQIATRLTGALHKRVRYTGLELGDAALIPATPADVYARQYGDCKDKAAALVGALRAAGLKASVALLLTGAGLDVNPELPGMGNFDHAIVYVDGPEPLWIDATAQYTRVGDLPTQDQGRLALIADPKTTGLVKIPESKAADNRSTHTVEIRLSDYGPASITETIEATGHAEAELRERNSGEPAKVKEAVETQAKQVYLVKSLGEVKGTPADDFSQPYRLTVAMEGANRGVTEDDQAGAGLFSHFVFSGLPYLLMPREKSEVEPKTERVQDLIFFQPYVNELRYRVFYPAFLKPKPLPKDYEAKVGPGVFRRTYRSDPSGYVEAVYRYESGPRRWSPADVAAARESLREIYTALPEMILFSSAASEPLALGKSREALRIARDYAAANPKSAAAQARLSRVLVAAGAGDAAVTTAKAATQLDEKSTQTWQALGWAYQHDTFGRRFGGNWNPADTEKAYRKAIDAAPDNLVPQMDLAIVFEHNQAGDRYGKGSRLADAVEGYRAILKKGANAVVQQNLAVALVRGGRDEEAAAELKKMPQDGMAVMLTAITDARLHGADRAILNLQGRAVDPNARYSILLNAAITLGQMREYELATELLRAARRIVASPDVDNRLAALAKLKRADQRRFGPDDPRSVVESLYTEVLSADLNLEKVKELVTKRDRDSVAAGATAELRRVIAGVRGKLRTVGMSIEAIADFAAGGIDYLQKGDDSFGYSISGLNAAGGSMPTMFVIKEDGRYRLLASSDSLENIGLLVLDLLKANQLDTAKKWLDLTTDVVKVSVTGVDGPAGRLMWSGLPANARTADMARIVAANYIGMYSVSDEAIAILKKARPTAANSVDRGQIDLALCQSYLKAEKWTELLASAKDLTASYAVADKSFDFVVKARTGLKQWAELEQDARAELKKSPDSVTGLRAAALAHIRAGAPEKASPYIDQLAKSSMAGSSERKLQAWHSLLVGAPTAALIQALEKDKANDNFDPAPHYLLGLLHAVMKNPEEAQRQLASALELEDWTLLDTRPFVLQGLIQQQYGNAETARSAFDEARKRPAKGDDAEWALRLLQSAATRNP